MLNLDPKTILSRVVILIIALSMHEFAHAWTATRFGDPTPGNAGRLTLNPLAHLDVFGSIMLLLVGFGWAKPVPINPYIIRQNNKAGVALVSLAGPFTNLLLAVIGALPVRFGLVALTSSSSTILPSLGQFLVEFVYTNVALFLFNLIPLAPLDGEKVLEFFIPTAWQEGFQKVRQYGPWLLLILIFIGPRIGFDLFGTIIREPLMKIVSFLFRI